MIKEFALEPSALATWKDFRYFVEKFGVPNGRLIAEFPGKWRRLVIEAARAAARPVEFQKIVERLNQRGDQILIARGRPSGDGTLSWLDRALTENDREPFDAIVACTNPGANPKVILDSDVEDSHPCFQIARQIEVERTAKLLVGCAEFMLRNTTTVKWVDYVIVPNAARWRRPLREAISILSAVGRAVVFQVHRQCEIGHEIQKKNLIQQFLDGFEAHRGKGIAFELYLYPERVLHDRFVLTDRGGIQIGHGLDDNEDGGGAPTANVTLLEQSMFEVQWNRFSSPESLVLRIAPDGTIRAEGAA